VASTSYVIGMELAWVLRAEWISESVKQCLTTTVSW